SRPRGSAQKIPSTSSKLFVRWRTTKSSSSLFTNRARNFSRCFTKPFCSTRAGGWSFSGPRLRACAACGTTRPEFIFDVLETPLRDLSGDIIYEENNRGQLVPARRYAPEFWRDKYEAFRLIQDVKQVSLRKEP